MTSTTTKPDSLQPAAEMAVDLFDNWFDPIETEVRARAREFIEEMIRGELDTVLARPRYSRSQVAGNEGRTGIAGHRHGSRTRSLTGTFGPIEIAVPRARLNTLEGKTTEWKSQALRAYQRRTLAADALIASTYLAGTNTRRVRRALAALFGGTVGKDTVSRTWRKVKGDWDAWNTRSLAEDPIVRLILDGTVVRVRLDRKATSISLLVVLGVRADGQKVLLAIKNMGGETSEAWRSVLDNLTRRGLQRPEFLIVDGAAGLDSAIAAVWDTVPLPTASRKPAHACSASPACLPNNGKARAPPMRSSGCTRSSSDGSRRKPCCLPPKPLQCCSGPCLPPVRSTCAKSTAGKRSPQRPSLSQLTSPPDKLCSNSRSLRYANSHHIPDGTRTTTANHYLCR